MSTEKPPLIPAPAKPTDAYWIYYFLLQLVPANIWPITS